MYLGRWNLLGLMYIGRWKEENQEEFFDNKVGF